MDDWMDFNGYYDEKSEEEKEEGKHDSVKDSIKNIYIEQAGIEVKRFKIKDIGGSSGVGTSVAAGTIDAKGDYAGMREVYVNARIIGKENGIKRMFFTAEDNISVGELEIVAVSEDEKPLQLRVKSVHGITLAADVNDGYIKIKDVKAKEKNVLDFSIYDNKRYAMRVRAYGNIGNDVF